MTDENIKKTIAESQGWDFNPVEVQRGDLTHDLWAKRPDGSLCLCPMSEIPNYPSDLNVMHEIELTLTQEQRFDYFYHLNEEVGLVEPFTPGWIKEIAITDIATATARQRAIAYLKTIGKWTEAD